MLSTLSDSVLSERATPPPLWVCARDATLVKGADAVCHSFTYASPSAAGVSLPL